MHTIGIISEYNPFHSGHRYQLEELRRTFGADCGLVCAMSGNWVQRGDAAITDKWNRAEMALRGGADLILELPTPWAVSSAETFARGGVSILNATGVVDTLSFGSECGDLPVLQMVADALESDVWRESLRGYLGKGLSFPAARQKAMDDFLGEAAQCMSTPNNNLGIEYLRALRHTGSSMMPHTIIRLGAAHDSHEDGSSSHVSASYLREKVLTGDPSSLSPYLSAWQEEGLRADPTSLSFCERAVLARLRIMEEEDFALLPDSGEGLSQRLYAASRQASSLEEVYSITKTKRYTHARIRRMVLWAFLGLSTDSIPETPPYIRVLGFTSRGQELLKEMKKTASLPVIVKPAHAAKLSAEARAVFELEARSTGVYDLCRKQFGILPGKNEYTQNPVRL